MVKCPPQVDAIVGEATVPRQETTSIQFKKGLVMGAASPSSGFGDGDVGAMSDINITPLVDVVLVLLIMFMLIVPAVMTNSVVKVELPESAAIAVSHDKLPLVFTMRQEEGQLALYLNGERTTEGAVRELLSNRSIPIEEQRSALSAESGIEYGEIVRFLDLLRSLGVSKLSLDTRHVER